MSRGTKAIFSLGALEHNLRIVRQVTSNARIMAVVKANAYAHGIESVVAALSRANGFAVATLGEAERVRKVSDHHRVLLLEGITDQAEVDIVRELRLDLVVHAPWQIKLLENIPKDPTIRVWLKVDTGMHRLGFPAAQAPAALAALRALGSVNRDIVLMSHLANADDRQDPKTARQIEQFTKLGTQLGLSPGSLANSAGALAWPQSRFEWVRIGLALYGASPLQGLTAADLNLRPCMTLTSSLIAINDCHPGDTIGYGSAYRCSQAMRVGVVAIGYGDGYPRNAPFATPVLVRGRRCPLIGRVSMDMSTIDLSDVPAAEVGDEVVLWGTELPVETVAQHVGTIAHDLLCGITARVSTVCR